MTDVQTTAVTTSTPKALSPMEAFRKEARAMEMEFRNALPPHIPMERFMRVVQTAVQTSMNSNFTNLLECDRRSLWQSCMKAAQDGLLPDGREGAVIKYGDKAQWLPMVAGIRKKARNSGEISTWDVHCVYKGDTFTLRLGDAPSIDHTYDLSAPRGELIGAYSVCVLKDGSKSYEVMSIEEIRGIRDRSSAWQAYAAKKIKTTPWATDEGEMARKTVAKRHAKQLPSSADLDDLLRRDDELYEFGKEEEPGSNIKTLPRRASSKMLLDQFAEGNKQIEGTAGDDPGEIPEGLRRRREVIPAHDKETGELKESAAAASTADGKAGGVDAERASPADPAEENPVPEFSYPEALELGREYARKKRPMNPPADMDAKFHDAFSEGYRDYEAEAMKAAKKS